jgi:hypothetical protein
MTAYRTPNVQDGSEPAQLKIPIAVHLACILLLIAITVCNGPLAAYFA